MKYRKQNKPAPTHQSALTVPSYHRILVKHGLIEKTLSISDAYKVFLKVGTDPEVQKLRRKVELGKDRKSTRLNSSHDQISYAVFCLKKKNKMTTRRADGTAAAD